MDDSYKPFFDDSKVRQAWREQELIETAKEAVEGALAAWISALRTRWKLEVQLGADPNNTEAVKEIIREELQILQPKNRVAVELRKRIDEIAVAFTGGPQPIPHLQLVSDEPDDNGPDEG